MHPDIYAVSLSSPAAAEGARGRGEPILATVSIVLGILGLAIFGLLLLWQPPWLEQPLPSRVVGVLMGWGTLGAIALGHIGVGEGGAGRRRAAWGLVLGYSGAAAWIVTVGVVVMLAVAQFIVFVAPYFVI
jgi:hypothetical protein